MSYPIMQKDPATVNDATVNSEKLGLKYRHYDSTYGWRTVMYVKNSDASVAIAAGTCVCWDGVAHHNVTADYSDGTAAMAGVGIGAITAAYGGFIVCGYGDWCLLNTDGGVAAEGEFLVPDAADGTVDTLDTDEGEQAGAVSTAADNSPDDQVVAILIRGC